jgi:transcriptional regulator with XRE-family HTH domain
MNFVAATFGKNLARHRRRIGLSQEALALRASLHRTEIGLLERGERTPRIDTIVKLAGGLGVPLNQLVEGITWNPGEVTAGRFTASGAE